MKKNAGILLVAALCFVTAFGLPFILGAQQLPNVGTGANFVLNGASANDTIYFDGTNWVNSSALTNDGTDIGVSGTLTATTALVVGTNPATTGAIRVPRTDVLVVRNNANSADLNAIAFNTSDVMLVGDANNLDVVVQNKATALLGFYGASPVVKPTVSGARDVPEEALADLIAELATLGIITDSTTVSAPVPAPLLDKERRQR